MSAQYTRIEAGYLLAESLIRRWPGTVLGTGGLTADGFRFDAALPGTPAGLLEAVGEELHKVAAEGPAPALTVSHGEAAGLLADQPLQRELLAALDPEGPVTVRRRGDFCVLESAVTAETEEAGAAEAPFPSPSALEPAAVSGAYWRGSSDNRMLTRVSGWAFGTAKELRVHKERLAEARARDHRKLGRELRIFTISDDIGAGLPLWLPRGTVIRRQLENWIAEEERVAGYQHVVTPQLAKRTLYERSGHWAHYAEDMFPVMGVAGEELVLRPMNCPHHITLFGTADHSYRELPYRLAELGTMYRYERSGVVGGLSRVRAMTLNDAHVFCTPEQVGEEFARVLELIERCYRTLGITNHHYRLSLRDAEGTSEKYVADDSLWARAEQTIRDCLVDLGLPFCEAPGEAAFYGPKLDIQLPDLFGREETLSTIQVDFHLPDRFGLEYVGPGGGRLRPVIIHRGVLSTMERMVAHLIELYAGAFPVWLAPVQIAVLPVSQEQEAGATAWTERLVRAGLRAEVVRPDGTLGARIRAVQADKVPYLAVLGERELTDGTVSVRRRGVRGSDEHTRETFEAGVLSLARDRSLSLDWAPAPTAS
ncbi:Threonyl-tRNA synthetase [Actinobacteria bacterium OK074]|nr:Threonyl-tRNA synthetase [Actinobacteria bacterium OK074]